MASSRDHRSWFVVGIAFASLFATGVGLVYVVGTGSGPGARLAGAVVAACGFVGALLAARAIARDAEMDASSPEQGRRGAIVVLAMLGLLALWMVLGPVLLVGLNVDSWVALAIEAPLVLLLVGLTARSLRATGLDVHPARGMAHWMRRGGPLALAVVVLVAGGYAPPIIDTWWRRWIGAASGVGMFALGLGYRRGWFGTRTREAEWWGPDTFGMFVGGVVALSWATGLVFNS